MKTKILITGIAGFVGKHLRDYISGMKNIEVQGFDKEIDIRDGQSVKRIIKKHKPNKIFHLAAQSSASLSYQNPQGTFEINVIGTINLLEAIKQFNSDSKILLIGSSTQYGQVKRGENPIKEKQFPRPIDPYSISKQSQEFLGKQYFLSGLKVIMTRSFAHTGPGQGEAAICGRWAKTIALAEKSKKKAVEIEVVNPNNIRDFTDVRDIVRAYWLLLKKGKPGEIYNVCQGRGYKMKEIIKLFQELSSIEVRIKESFKPNDTPLIIGDNKKLKRTTNWRSKIDFLKQTLPDLLNYWRKEFNHK